MKENTRRSFLQGTLALGAAAALPLNLQAAHKPDKLRLPEGARILFQGDSITDGGRSRNDDWNHVMGHGYAYLLASRLCFDYPEKNYHFFNRGISGNTVPDLLNRWEKDTLELKPDILSILVGVNDASAAVDNKPGFDADTYDKKYRSLLDLTRKNLPETRLVICEPFILPVGKIKTQWAKWQDEIQKQQQVAKELAKEYNCAFVPFQSHFDKALKRAPEDFWMWDGVHPMPAGHELMARVWLKEVSNQIIKH